MADRILAKELVDYSKTDKLLEWQRLIPWINNFAQKKAIGDREGGDNSGQGQAQEGQ